jgi:peptidoglycan/LPS O-acetylase OafA/YrhL
LSLPPLAQIGRSSYSRYLWHCPILVFAEKYGLFRLRLRALMAELTANPGFRANP